MPISSCDPDWWLLIRRDLGQEETIQDQETELGCCPLPSTPLFPCTAQVFAEDAAISNSSGAQVTAGHSPRIQSELSHTGQLRI